MSSNCFSLEELVLLNLYLSWSFSPPFPRLLPVKDDRSQIGVFLLQSFELFLYLLSRFAHISGDNCEIAAIFSEQRDECHHFIFGPVGIITSRLHCFLLFFANGVLEGNLISVGGECTDCWWCSIESAMIVCAINSHLKDTTGSVWEWGTCKGFQCTADRSLWCWWMWSCEALI